MYDALSVVCELQIRGTTFCTISFLDHTLHLCFFFIAHDSYSLGSGNMLKRFSTFRKGKKEGENGAVANGSHPTSNGVANGANGNHTLNGHANSNGNASPQSPNRPTKRFSFGPPKRQESSFNEPDHSVTRGDVDSAFDQFAQLVSASRRPLPTQTGDGSYLEHDAPSSLFQDLKALGFKDVKTFRELLASKISGALNDDKTMLMERIIQVQKFYSFAAPTLTDSMHSS